ncbi:hypothetical protein AEST_25170 [Alishewanella aestuarii B11]|uniref:Uncharacterized protein n=1 Tax=Alishewanella aestuarii B11 TaxID=1197174 RepID=J2ID28_9ALTE|nr:hypothetical protein AEST_25170 [Alishewanella aestuarii B11]
MFARRLQTLKVYASYKLIIIDANIDAVIVLSFYRALKLRVLKKYA